MKIKTYLLFGVIVGCQVFIFVCGRWSGKMSADHWWQARNFPDSGQYSGPTTKCVVGSTITIPDGEIVCWNGTFVWIEKGKICHFQTEGVAAPGLDPQAGTTGRK